MRRACLLLLLLLVAGCRPAGGVTPASLPAAESPAHTPTWTTPELSATPSPVSAPEPGLLIRGRVRLPDGSGLAGVRIYRAFASYPGEVVAITDRDGYYESPFQYIPGDETVRVWAELAGHICEPADATGTGPERRYHWRHYYGHDDRTLDFVARPVQ